MIDIMFYVLFVVLIVYVLFLRAEVKRIGIQISWLKIRAGAIKLDVDELAQITTKAVETLSDASVETMKAVMELRKK